MSKVDTLSLARAKALAELGFSALSVLIAAAIGGQADNFGRWDNEGRRDDERKTWREGGGGGGGVLIVVHGCGTKTINPRVLTIPGLSTSGLTPRVIFCGFPMFPS